MSGDHPNYSIAEIGQNTVKSPGVKNSGLGSWQTSGDHRNYYIIENGQNAEKSPGDLRRLAVTQTPVKDHQLKLVRKTLMSK